MEIVINYVAVLVAAILNFVIGMVWYSPMLFYKKWAKLMNLKESDMKSANMGLIFGLTMLGNLLLAYMLQYFFKLSMISDLAGAIVGAIMVWVGFTFPFTNQSVLFEKKPPQAYYINIAYHLVTLVVMAMVFVLMP